MGEILFAMRESSCEMAHSQYLKIPSIEQPHVSAMPTPGLSQFWCLRGGQADPKGLPRGGGANRRAPMPLGRRRALKDFLAAGAPTAAPQCRSVAGGRGGRVVSSRAQLG